MDSFYCTNWFDLPVEIQVMIIQRMSLNDRLAMRSCSRSIQQIVDSIPYRSIHYLYIANTENHWQLRIKRTEFGKEECLKFETFDDFQKGLDEEMADSCYVRKLCVRQTNRIKSVVFPNLLRVGKLTMGSEMKNPENILKQVDPFNLRKLLIFHSYELYDMPQVIHANYVHFRETCSIQDNQLLQIESSKIQMLKTKNLTSTGINKFIKKCNENLDHKKINFQIGYEEERLIRDNLFDGLDFEKNELIGERLQKVVLMTKSDELRLELTIGNGLIEGKTISISETGKKKVVKKLGISEEPFLSLMIKEKGGFLVKYDFDSLEKLEEKLAAELEKIDYIKKLYIGRKNRKHWKLCSEANKLITVGKVILEDSAVSTEHLQQIEPLYLKDIMIYGVLDDPRITIYELPQVVHAKHLDMSYCCVRDYQLLNFEAVELSVHIEKNNQLSYSGINKFLKKCLSSLNQHDYNFVISFSNMKGKRDELYKNLKVCRSTKDRFGTLSSIIDSPESGNYQLELEDNEYSVEGKRIRRIDQV